MAVLSKCNKEFLCFVSLLSFWLPPVDFFHWPKPSVIKGQAAHLSLIVAKWRHVKQYALSSHGENSNQGYFLNNSRTKCWPCDFGKLKDNSNLAELVHRQETEKYFWNLLKFFVEEQHCWHALNWWEQQAHQECLRFPFRYRYSLILLKLFHSIHCPWILLLECYKPLGIFEQVRRAVHSTSCLAGLEKTLKYSCLVRKIEKAF